MYYQIGKEQNDLLSPEKIFSPETGSPKSSQNEPKYKLIRDERNFEERHQILVDQKCGRESALSQDERLTVLHTDKEVSMFDDDIPISPRLNRGYTGL